jgi:hypothetical protein
MDVNKYKTHHQYDGFDKELIIAGCRATDFEKVFTDLCFQFCMERMVDIGKFWKIHESIL